MKSVLQRDFERNLEKLMQEYEVRSLSYTNDDDGLHAFTDTEDWELGWPTA